MIRVYNAGPLFNESEQKQRTHEEREIVRLYEEIGLTNKDFTIFNPFTQPFNTQDRPDSVGIFTADYAAISRANVFFFDLSNRDTGTFMELGMALELRKNNPDIKIYPVISDLRLGSNIGMTDGLEVPVGFNSFVIGALRANGIRIFTDFDTALKSHVRNI